MVMKYNTVLAVKINGDVLMDNVYPNKRNVIEKLTV